MWHLFVLTNIVLQVCGQNECNARRAVIADQRPFKMAMEGVDRPVDHARIVYSHHDVSVPLYGIYEDECSRELPQVPEIAHCL